MQGSHAWIKGEQKEAPLANVPLLTAHSAHDLFINQYQKQRGKDATLTSSKMKSAPYLSQTDFIAKLCQH
jgi:hypothetical protein